MEEERRLMFAGFWPWFLNSAAESSRVPGDGSAAADGPVSHAERPPGPGLDAIGPYLSAPSERTNGLRVPSTWNALGASTNAPVARQPGRIENAF